MWGSGGIAPPFLTSAYDGVECQLHILAALLLGKETIVFIGQEVAWAPELV
jgi:hypothetical protein